MIDPLEIAGMNVLQGTEGSLVEVALGALIDDGALRAIKRYTVNIAFQKMLTDLGTDRLKEEAVLARIG
jgi:hypothetical protein